MGIFETIGGVVSGITKPINAVVDTAQNIFDLHKDINNIDTERQVDASKELMAQQDAYNQAAFGRSADLQREMFGKQSDFQRDMFNRQLEANKQVATDQFVREAYLTSAGRQAYEMRMNGLNPAGSASGFGGTAAAIGAPSASIPTGSAPSQQGVSPSIPGSSKYSPGNGSEALAKDVRERQLQEKQQDFERSLRKGAIDADTRNKNADAQSTEIENLFKYQQLVFDLQERLARIDKLRAEGKKLSTDEEAQRNTYKAQIKYWQDTIDVMQRNAAVNERNAVVNETNAQTRIDELEETKRNNRVNNGIQNALVALQERNIILNEAKLKPEIDKLIADTQLSLKNVEFTKEQIPVIRAKIESEIAKNNKLQNFIHEQAIKTKKESDLIKYQIATQMATSIVNSASNVVNAVSPLKIVSGTGSVPPVGVSTSAPSYY